MPGLALTLPSAALLGLIGAAAGAATYLGGALALKVRGYIRFILGFSAGAVIAVALFDLLPEASALGAGAHSGRLIFACAGAGFGLYMLLDRGLQALSGGGLKHRGHLGPASLTAHSLLDGLGIGLAFHVSRPAGMVLTLAVLAHDFSDGVNTVNLSLAGQGPKTARKWLLADAIAPIVGILAAQLLVVRQSQLSLLLAGFAGVFLYIGAGELAPESHRRFPHLWTTIATLLGMAMIYAAVRLAGSS